MSGGWRFRRRLTGAFILVAATAAGLLAVVSYVLVREHRVRTFEREALDDARIGLLLAPERFSTERVQDLLVGLRRRGGYEAVVVGGGVAFSSTPAIGEAAVPEALLQPSPGGDLGRATTTVRGTRYLVVAGSTADDGVDAYFFFSEDDLRRGLDELRTVLAVVWVLTLLFAAVVGRAVSRRTLRPVAEAASASRALASGLLQTRLEPSSDEFAGWAAAFNEMAEALQDKIIALEAAAARERRFTEDVAHELRTPVAALAANIELLADRWDGLPDDVRAEHEALRLDVVRLRDLVLDLLELARLDAADAPVAPRPMRVRPAVEAMVARRGADDAVTVDVDESLAVLAEPLRLARVLGNLIGNALEHGGGAAAVAASRSDGFVRITVDDCGPGIEADDVDRIFDRFHKQDPARGGGSGLGLSIAREHAVALGGGLAAANRDGGGARFTVSLPAADDDGAEAAGVSW